MDVVYSMRPVLDPLNQLFSPLTRMGIESEAIVKLFDAAAAMSLKERIVSERDAHASVTFNGIVGDMLYDKVVQFEPQKMP